jgi:DTW domain-containing protein YfiP
MTPLPTKLHVLILQHPQEPDKELGSARIASQALSNSTLRIGLSWPNLSKALGRPAIHGNWGVLYLGGKAESRAAIEKKVSAVSALSTLPLEGIVALDGTWAQAKTMWWRNPWLLKLKRIALNPKRRSLYGNLRREPRRECLSTIESIAEALEALGENPAVGEALRGHFVELLRKFRPPRDPASSAKTAHPVALEDVK